MALRKEEVQRKILHFFSGLILAAGIFYLPQLIALYPRWSAIMPPWAYPTVILAGTLGLHLIFEFLRMHSNVVSGRFNAWFGSMLRESEAHELTGSTWINAAALLCSIAFRHQPHISFMVLLMFIWGDAVAALVGQSVGRIKIGAKSLEGSLACFVLSFICMGALFPNVPGLLQAWNGSMPLAMIVVAPLAVTLLELVPMKIGPRFEINDNVIVPLITGYIMRLLESGL